MNKYFILLRNELYFGLNYFHLELPQRLIKETLGKLIQVHGWLDMIGRIQPKKVISYSTILRLLSLCKKSKKLALNFQR